MIKLPVLIPPSMHQPYCPFQYDYCTEKCCRSFLVKEGSGTILMTESVNNHILTLAVRHGLSVPSVPCNVRRCAWQFYWHTHTSAYGWGIDAMSWQPLSNLQGQLVAQSSQEFLEVIQVSWPECSSKQAGKLFLIETQSLRQDVVWHVLYQPTIKICSSIPTAGIAPSGGPILVLLRIARQKDGYIKLFMSTASLWSDIDMVQWFLYSSYWWHKRGLERSSGQDIVLHS